METEAAAVYAHLSPYHRKMMDIYATLMNFFNTTTAAFVSDDSGVKDMDMANRIMFMALIGDMSVKCRIAGSVEPLYKMGFPRDDVMRDRAQLVYSDEKTQEQAARAYTDADMLEMYATMASFFDALIEQSDKRKGLDDADKRQFMIYLAMIYTECMMEGTAEPLGVQCVNENSDPVKLLGNAMKQEKHRQARQQRQNIKNGFEQAVHATNKLRQLSREYQAQCDQNRHQTEKIASLKQQQEEAKQKMEQQRKEIAALHQVLKCNIEQKQEERRQQLELCHICFDVPFDTVYVNCGHVCCAQCVKNHRDKLHCPFCRRRCDRTQKLFFNA
jgi:hypothetical protein